MPTPDTMRASTKCFSTAGSCERLMQITADPDFETIEMKVLLRIKRETAARFTFMLRRTPDSVAVVYGRKEDSKENRQK
jgi:hypothetical protein